MKIDRRRALALLGLGAAAPTAGEAHNPPPVTFEHGVASGDPLEDRVIIWTRLSGATSRLPLIWQVALDRDFNRVVASGLVTSGPERDFTYKVDVAGLRPGTDYFYRFRFAPPPSETVDSPIGRTRTLPTGATRDVVLAVASCTLYPNGYFNAYKAIADLPRVDAVLHLGDYIYEYGGPGSYGMNSPVAGERPHDPPREVVSLADYRARHAQYKADPDLQAAHARAPWIVVWDDHETANDSFHDGAQNHQPATEGDWNARKAAALKAYFEWMPIRDPAAGQGLAEAALRSFRFGDLAQLVMVETRLTARDKQLTIEADLMKGDQMDVAGFKAKLADPNRRMMTPAQETWIGRELAASVGAGHAWQVIGNQVVMARVRMPDPKEVLTPAQFAAMSESSRRRYERLAPVAAAGLPTALDMWDGYPVDRERLYQVFRQAKARPIVVSGDSHSFWANELHTDAGERVACEFGTTGVTSPGGGEVAPGLNGGDLIAKASPEVIFNDQVAKGFVLLTLTRQEARADLVAVSTITARDFTTSVVKSFRARPEGTGVSALA